MKVLFDCNVVLDVMLDRPPDSKGSAAAFALVESRIVQGVLAAHSITVLDYILAKQLGRARTRRVLLDLAQVFTIAPVDQNVIRNALATNVADFEDAVTACAARQAKCEYIVTRDKSGFRNAGIEVIRPEMLSVLAARQM